MMTYRFSCDRRQAFEKIYQDKASSVGNRVRAAGKLPLTISGCLDECTRLEVAEGGALAKSSPLALYGLQLRAYSNLFPVVANIMTTVPFAGHGLAGHASV